jgi:uncharacterized protein (TIGR02246 family)
MENVTIDARQLGERFYAALEEAWNAADGEAFGSHFSEVTDFVNIQGEHFHGDSTVIAAGHRAIFDTIYRGSTVSYHVDRARQIGPGSLLVHATSTLDAPHGPLRGINQSKMTAVLVEEQGAWKATAFHNTLVAPS